jgi:hypothetical protein
MASSPHVDLWALTQVGSRTAVGTSEQRPNNRLQRTVRCAARR